MPIVEARTTIRTCQSAAFALSQDYARRAEWDPFAAKLKAYVRDPGSPFADITAWHGARMRVEYVAWFPPERAAIRMVSGPRMLESFAGSWAFQQRGELVDARFRYQIKAKPLWRWLEPLMLAYFKWETHRRLQALKCHLEERPHAAS